jgi:HK97 gp10 family phage protein
MISGMKITGVSKIKLNLDRLDKSVIEDVQKSINTGAKTIADRARQKAPRGPSGNLKDAIHYKQMPIKPGIFPLVAIAAVDWLKAPHAHWIEYGTSNIREPKKSKVLYNKKTGKFYGTKVGPIPAQPFLRPAFDQSKSEIEKLIDNALSAAVRRHA